MRRRQESCDEGCSPRAKTCRVLLVLALLLCGRPAALFAREAELTGSKTLIVADEWSPPVQRAADRLIEYVKAVTGAAPATAKVAPPDQAGWVFFLLRHELPRLRADGFELEVDPALRRAWIRAPGPQGLMHGVHQLIREMRQESKSLFLSSLSLRKNPWVKSRELFIAEIEWHPTESEEKVLGELQQKFSWLNWDQERLHRYIEMLEAMGYNAVMLSDSDQMRWYAGESTDAEEGVNKVRSMLEYARSRGMGTTFFIWGQRGLEGLLENPRDPDQLADILRYQDRMIDRYAPLADRWILHWADPGGCSLRGCTINTPQVITNRFFRRLRQRGYQSGVSFSLWALRWGGWPGYANWSSVVESSARRGRRSSS